MKARNGTTSQCGTWRVIAVFAAILACALSLSATLFTSPALAEGDTLTVNFARYSVPDRVHDGFTDADTGTVLYCSDFYLHSPSTGTVLTKQGAAGITLDYLCYFGYGGAGYDDTVGIQGYTGNIARTITQQAIWMVIGSDTIAPSNGHGYPGTAASPLRSYDAEAEAFANEARANASDSAIYAGTSYFYGSGDSTLQRLIGQTEHTGKVTLKKASADPSVTDGNGCYSLAGGVFTFRSADGSEVGTLTTDASGNTGEIALAAGTYTLSETTTPKGYLTAADQTVTVVSGQSTTVTVTDVPANDPAFVRVQKSDADGSEAAQGDASLTGAQFEVSYFANTDGDTSGEPTRTWTFSTGEGGYCDFNDASEYVGGDALYTNPDGAVVMPVGSYSVRETKAPDGYLVDPTTYTAQVKIDPEAASGQGADWVWDANPNSKHIDVDQQGNATLTQSEQVALGGLSVQKYDAESGSDLPMGSATLAGAEFTIINRSAAPIVYKGKTIPVGGIVDVIATVASESGVSVASTGEKDLPYGTYLVTETKAPTGYVLNSDYAQTVQVRADGTLYKLEGIETQTTLSPGSGCGDQVIRADFSFTKAAGVGGQRLADIPFSVKSDATGETHVIVTDANGYYSSASAWASHTTNTNGNDALLSEDGSSITDSSKLDPAAGIWFGSYKSTAGASGTTEADDALGALPYGTYTVTELGCDNNAGLDRASFKLTVGRNGVTYDMGTVDDNAVNIGTRAHDSKSGTNYGFASTTSTVVDTVSYEGLTVGRTYVMELTLMNTSTGDVVTDADGKAITASKEFTPETSSGSVDVEATFDSTTLTSVTCFEQCKLDGSIVAKHEDITDTDQTVTYPRIGTTAVDKADGDHTVDGTSTSVTVIDTVSYDGLKPGVTYVVTGTLMDQATGEAVEIDGKPVTGTATFTPDKSSGSVEVAFNFDATKVAGKTLVAFEDVSTGDTKVATHADINDSAQTVTVTTPPATTTTTTMPDTSGGIASFVLIGLGVALVAFGAARALRAHKAKAASVSGGSPV